MSGNTTPLPLDQAGCNRTKAAFVARGTTLNVWCRADGERAGCGLRALARYWRGCTHGKGHRLRRGAGMMLTVAEIVGLPGLPSTRFGLRQWLKRLAIPLAEDGNRFTFALSELPDAVRRAFLEREAERMGLEAGTWDEAAYAALLRAPATLGREAERKAEVMRFMAPRAYRARISGRRCMRVSVPKGCPCRRWNAGCLQDTEHPTTS